MIKIYYTNKYKEILASDGHCCDITISKDNILIEPDLDYSNVTIDKYDLCYLMALWDEVYGPCSNCELSPMDIYCIDCKHYTEFT